MFYWRLLLGFICHFTYLVSINPNFLPIRISKKREKRTKVFYLTSTTQEPSTIPSNSPVLQPWFEKSFYRHPTIRLSDDSPNRVVAFWFWGKKKAWIGGNLTWSRSCLDSSFLRSSFLTCDRLDYSKAKAQEWIWFDRLTIGKRLRERERFGNSENEGLFFLLINSRRRLCLSVSLIQRLINRMIGIKKE